MVVKAFRYNEGERKEVDINLIYKDSVRWTNNRKLNNQHIPTPYYLLKCQIDYDDAIKLGLASGLHENCADRANIFLYAKDNKNDLNYKEGYAYLCSLAGTKPQRAKKNQNIKNSQTPPKPKQP